jgi:hypothetical protein
VSSSKQKKGNLNKKNNLFKEVIVEDEAEDIRGSQLGSNPDQFLSHSQALKKSQAATNIDQ